MIILIFYALPAVPQESAKGPLLFWAADNEIVAEIYSGVYVKMLPKYCVLYKSVSN